MDIEKLRAMSVCASEKNRGKSVKIGYDRNTSDAFRKMLGAFR